MIKEQLEGLPILCIKTLHREAGTIASAGQASMCSFALHVSRLGTHVRRSSVSDHYPVHHALESY